MRVRDGLFVCALFALPVLTLMGFTQNFPQPGPGISGFFSPGDIFSSATACWSFNDPTDLGNDDCTNTYDLTPVNTPTATGGANGYTSDFENSGVTSQAAITDNASLSLSSDTSFTINAWVTSESLRIWNVVVMKGPGGGTSLEYLISTWGQTDKMTCSLSDGATAGGDRMDALPVGQRGMVTCVHNGPSDTVEMYVNAATDGSSAWTAGTQDLAGVFYVGNSPTADTGWDGKIGPVTFWNGRALTAGEITTLYNSGYGKSCADLSAAEQVGITSCWEFDEPSGSFADAYGSNTLARSTGPTVSSPGLVALDAADAGIAAGYGAEYDTTLTAVNTPTRAAGLVERSDSGMAVSVVGGSDQYLNVAGFNPTTTGGYTLAQWFSLSELLDGHGAGIPNQFLFYNDYTNALIYDDGFILPSCSGGNPDDGDWHLAIMWVDTSTGKGYCTIDDGTSAGTALTGSYVAVNGTFSVGKVNSSPSSSAIDNTAFWPRPLTSDERATLYNSGAGTYYASAWGDMIHNGPYYASADPIMLQPLRYPPPSSRRFYVR